ncbi:MAG: hypothetical protein GY811_16915 [Myxococcales bacterium]|nr:hypothetical protein [Myxococcales bacterium]
MTAISMTAIRSALFSAVLATTACASDYSDEPVWDGEIETILVANCARCHGETNVPGAPDDLRRDQYAGAFESRKRIRARYQLQRIRHGANAT